MKFWEANLVLLSLVVHQNGWYVTSNEWLKIPANFSSMSFVLAAALFTVQRLDLPTTPYNWPPAFCRVYKVVVMFWLPTVTHGFIWIPLTYKIAEFQATVGKFLLSMSPTSKQELFMPVVTFLTCPTSQAIEQLLIALYVLYSSAVATGYFCQLKNWISSFNTKCKNVVAPTPGPVDDDCDSDSD